MEKGGFRYGIGVAFIGTKHRQDIVGWATKNFNNKKGNMEMFAYDSNTAFDLYMMGLPSIVGWDIMKTVMHSYLGDKNKPDEFKTYATSDLLAPANHADKAHEFFNRVVYFNDKALVANGKQPQGKEILNG